MTHLLPPTGDGHTEIPEEDRAALIPTYIANLGELFAAEQANIAAAIFARHPSVKLLLDDLYLRRLHRAMFGRVWTWAGQYRTRETNIGVDPLGIATSIRDLTADAAAWVDLCSFEPDDISLRFHHRLVQIHPFVNGNGRHGRVAADLLARALGRPPFSWGRNLDIGTHELRSHYQAALHRMDADREDLAALAHFARS